MRVLIFVDTFLDVSAMIFSILCDVSVLFFSPNLPASYEKNPNSSASGQCFPPTVNWNDNFSNGNIACLSLLV